MRLNFRELSKVEGGQKMSSHKSSRGYILMYHSSDYFPVLGDGCHRQLLVPNLSSGTLNSVSAGTDANVSF